MITYSFLQHTCVHDLRDSKERNITRGEPDEAPRHPSVTAPSPQYLLSLSVDNGPIDLSTRRRHHNGDTSPTHHRERSRSPLRQEQPSTSNDRRFRSSTYDFSQSEILSRVLPSAQQRLDSLAQSYASTNDQFMIFIQGGSDGVHQTLVLFADDRRNSARKPPSPKNGKLMFYVEEPNMGRGFIKEPCFSYDGRIICSPFAHGVRLLGYDGECNELEDKLTPSSGPKKATELQEVASIYSHQNLVVATKYSPTHHLLVTGCLDGQVCFHQPLL